MTAAGLAIRSEPSGSWRHLEGRGLLPFVPALLCPAGCSQSPSQDIMGSFFPAWMLCGVIGIAAAILCRVVLGAVRLHEHVLAPTLAYLAVTTAVTLVSWLTWFGH